MSNFVLNIGAVCKVGIGIKATTPSISKYNVFLFVLSQMFEVWPNLYKRVIIFWMSNEND